jgi:hypothetical protein
MLLLLVQDMAPFQWVMAWADYLPESQMTSLLDVGFFPQWKRVRRVSKQCLFL